MRDGSMPERKETSTMVGTPSKYPEQLKYRTGPFVEERVRFLTHLAREGRSLSRLQALNALLLSVAQYVDLGNGRDYTKEELIEVANRWHECLESPRTRSGRADRAHIAKTDFIFAATSLLRFLGRLHEPTTSVPIRSTNSSRIWNTKEGLPKLLGRTVGALCSRF
jgi:hypothetical protein